MKVYIISIVLFKIFLSLATAKGLQHRTREIDLVLEALKEQQWSQHEQSCYHKTVFILDNAKNYTVWAMWIWNSMQYPVGMFYGAPFSLGHYDQCLEAPTKAVDVTTQYCLADVKLTSRTHPWKSRSAMGDTESFLGTRNHMNRDISKVTWGVCLPAECKPGSAAKILKTIYMVNPLVAAEPRIEIEHCDIAGIKRDFSAGFYAFMSFMLVLAATTVFSTIYGQGLNPKLRTTQVLQCFCLKRNWIALTKVSTSENISSMNIIKVLFVILAVILHALYFRTNGPIANVFYIDWAVSVTESDIYVKNVTKHFSMALDIFFTISGLLLMRGLLLSKKHPLISLVGRYFRLVGLFALVTFYVAVVSIHTGDGPLWQKLAGREQKASLENWPWALLMLNNFVNSENITQIVAWHVPCDYQLATIGTLIFMIWKKNRRLGKIVAVVVFALAVLTPAVVTYCKQLPDVVIIYDIGKLVDIRTNEVFLETYIKSYHRAVPYLIGMGMGYFMSIYKPENHRKFISSKPSLFVFIAIFVSLIKTFIGFKCDINDRLTAAVTVSYEKLYIGVVTCTWIAVVEYGSLSLVRSITKLHAITVLSRLTYGIYLTHSLFLQQNAFSRRYIQQFEILTEVTYSIGIICLTIMTSVLLWLLVEAPVYNLLNYIHPPEDYRIKAKKDDEFSYDKIARAEIHQTEKFK